MPMRPNDQPSQDRQIRVFISSTFLDMQEERNVLIKKIFPQLRKMCEERAVTWTEVDLRWGITTEQAAEGKVLPLCLEEIRRCRPYFIGLLGGRYGWVPEPGSIPAELLESQPWLRQHLQHSVTELEILHGVFNEEAMHGHAYFYFRDSKYLELVPADKRQIFTSEGSEAAGKLERLKQKIRAAHDELVCELRENYVSPEQLGEWMLEDFTKLIDQLFPKDQTPDPLDQEAARHEAYARSRRLAFVGREDLLRRLNEHASSGSKPLVLTGESGCGKSALLAEWAARWRKDHPDDLIIQHYIGSTPDSADWQGLVRRILGELKHAFAIPDDLPLQPDALRSALNDWTVKSASLIPSPVGRGRVAGSRGEARKVILVLDALNQLADDGPAQQLGWVPLVFPTNFSVVLSALPSESLDALRRRGWPELSVPLFVQVDIAPAALAYFKIFSKTPPQDIVAKLESTPAACNALYLRAVLDELRQFGKHEELKSKAAEYLAATDLPELFDRILTRWETDFGESLVRQSLSLIWAARRGLSEAELADLLGEDGQPLPRAKWTPFYLAAEYSFAQRSGVLNFSHDYMREAAHNAYLASRGDEIASHHQLAAYFNVESGTTARTLDELPWQFAAAGSWDRLVTLLADTSILEALWNVERRDVERYWARVESNSSFKATNTYQHVATLEPLSLGTLHVIANLLRDMGYLRESLPFRVRLVEQAIRDTKLAHAADSLNDLGTIYISLGDLPKASSALAQSIALYKCVGDALGLQMAVANAVHVMEHQGQFQQALSLVSSLEERYRKDEQDRNLEAVLGMKGNILLKRGDYEQAMLTQLERERICRALADPRTLSMCVGDIANICLVKGDHVSALERVREQETLCRNLGNVEGLQVAIGTRAYIYMQHGDFRNALISVEEKEQLCRNHGLRGSLLKALATKGSILRIMGRAEQADAALRQAESDAQELNDRFTLGGVMLEQARLAISRRQTDIATSRSRGAKQAFTEIGAQANVADCLGVEADIYAERGETDQALELLEQQERILRACGDSDSLQSCLSHKSSQLRAKGRLDLALSVLQEVENICKRLGNTPGLARCLANQGLVTAMNGRRRMAVLLLRDAEALATKAGHSGLASEIAAQIDALSASAGDVSAT
jgi:tetratricopeptide (TPR) repeat protein